MSIPQKALVIQYCHILCHSCKICTGFAISDLHTHRVPADTATRSTTRSGRSSLQVESCPLASGLLGEPGAIQTKSRLLMTDLSYQTVPNEPTAVTCTSDPYISTQLQMTTHQRRQNNNNNDPFDTKTTSARDGLGVSITGRESQLSWHAVTDHVGGG